MKILWIGGWAITTDLMRTLVTSSFPRHNNLFIHPHNKFSDYIHKLKPDAIVGYSLGATLLLNHPQNLSKEYLIAPFINIKGATQVNHSQLKYLLKWLKNDPLSAINDFYQSSQLFLPKLMALPYSLPELIWGIEILLKTQELLVSSDKQIFVGERDPLINSRFFLQGTLNSKSCPDADHNLQSYLNFLPF